MPLRATWRTREARERVRQAGKGRRTVELAAKAQAVLEAYSRDLLNQKLRLLLLPTLLLPAQLVQHQKNHPLQLPLRHLSPEQLLSLRAQPLQSA